MHEMSSYNHTPTTPKSTLTKSISTKYMPNKKYLPGF